MRFVMALLGKPQECCLIGYMEQGSWRVSQKEGNEREEGLGWKEVGFCCISYHVSDVMELDFLW